MTAQSPKKKDRNKGQGHKGKTAGATPGGCPRHSEASTKREEEEIPGIGFKGFAILDP
jgi:hypothetical protein